MYVYIYMCTSGLPSKYIDGFVLLPWCSAALAEVRLCFVAFIVIMHCSFKLHLQKFWPCFGTWTLFAYQGICMVFDASGTPG